MWAPRYPSPVNPMGTMKFPSRVEVDVGTADARGWRFMRGKRHLPQTELGRGDPGETVCMQYEKPVVQRFGTLRELTLAGGSTLGPNPGHCSR